MEILMIKNIKNNTAYLVAVVVEISLKAHYLIVMGFFHISYQGVQKFVTSLTKKIKNDSCYLKRNHRAMLPSLQPERRLAKRLMTASYS